MAENNGTPASQEKDIITLVDEKISQDSDFQTELSALSDEDKATKLSEKKIELIRQEYASLSEKAGKDAELANNYKTRAENAEGKLKNRPPENTKTNDPQLSDELKLIARGLPDELIEQAKIIAKGKTIPLLEAIKDKSFLILKEKFDEDERREKARLGASQGSGDPEEQITGTESGSSREDHKKAFEKIMGKK